MAKVCVQYNSVRGFREGPVVEYWLLSRGREFDSQHPPQRSPPFKTPALGDPVPLSGLCRYMHTHGVHLHNYMRAQIEIEFTIVGAHKQIKESCFVFFVVNTIAQVFISHRSGGRESMDEGQEGLLVVRDLFQGRWWPPSHLRIFFLDRGVACLCTWGEGKERGRGPHSLHAMTFCCHVMVFCLVICS